MICLPYWYHLQALICKPIVRISGSFSALSISHAPSASPPFPRLCAAVSMALSALCRSAHASRDGLKVMAFSTFLESPLACSSSCLAAAGG